MKRLTELLLRSLCIFCCMHFALIAHGQAAAALSGRVEDASGGVIGKAEVALRNQGTDIQTSAMTESDGRYIFTNVSPGMYSLEVVSAGFAKTILKDIKLSVAEQSSLDVKMSIAGASDTVNVSEASVPVTETESSSNGAVIDNQKVVGLPLNQRSFFSLTTLVPGTFQSPQSTTTSYRGGFSVAGSNDTSNTFTINGADDSDTAVGVPNFRPSVETIQEFKLLTGVYAAEYGHSSGGQVVILTKSGTNQLHGDAFEFIRNQVTDARNYFLQKTATPAFRRNQWGGVLGGPVVIPKLYNGKDRTFFFVSYEQLGLAQSVTLNTTVPTAAMKAGNFTGVGSIIDPTTGKAFTTPNVIPAARITAIGQALAALYPDPNGEGTTYALNETRTENQYIFSVRLDHKVSEKDNLNLNYNYFYDPSFEPSNSTCGGGVLPGMGCYVYQSTYLASLSETHAFSPNLLNQFVIGTNYLKQPRIGEDAKLGSNYVVIPGADIDTNPIDAPQSFNGLPRGNANGIPVVSVSGFAGLGTSSTPNDHRDAQLEMADNFTWLKGSHSMKFGIQLRRAQSNEHYNTLARGSLTFNTSSAKSAGGLTTGNAFADLLLGYMYQTARSPLQPGFHARQNNVDAYGQDDFKVSHNLTLNYGLRWEYNGPYYDAFGTISGFDPTSGTIVTGGNAGYGRGLYAKDLNNFAPRVGLAYQPLGKASTVIHAGFGVFYNYNTVANSALSLFLQQPFRNPQTFTTKTGSSLTYANAYPTANTATSVTPVGIDKNYREMYVLERSASVQQQLIKDTSLEVGYFGAHGNRLNALNNVNQAAGSNTNRPYAAYGNILMRVSTGQSEFNSMQVKLQRTAAHGIGFLVAYTYSKSADDAPGTSSSGSSSSGTPQNSLLPLKAEWGLSDFNAKHRLVVSPVIELPFGRGKKYLSSGPASAILGGFQLSSLFQYQTGRPFTVTNTASNVSLLYNNVDRPNVSGDPNAGAPHTVGKWFNTSVYSSNLAGQIGNARRNQVIGPGYAEFDIALQRNFRFTDCYGAQLRFENFNVLNHPNFYNPLGTGTGAFGTSLFGQITQAYDPRSMQAAVKFIF